MFFSFSTQNNAESFGNYLKNSILDHLFFSITIFSRKSSFLTSRQPFLIKNNVLQVSGRNTLENAYRITSKSKFSTPVVQFSSHLHPALSYSLLHGCFVALRITWEPLSPGERLCVPDMNLLQKMPSPGPSPTVPNKKTPER